MVRIALYGSSYLERLRHFAPMIVPGNIRFFSYRGMRTTRQIATTKLEELLKWDPDIVFIQLGGNDFDVSTPSRDIACRILSIIDSMKKDGRTIIYGGILPRGDFRKAPGLDMLTFEEKRRDINRRIRKRMKSNFVRFTDVRYPEDFSDDLIHLKEPTDVGENIGIVRYKRRIERVFRSLTLH